MGEFLEALETLVTQPRRNRTWLPVVVLRRPADARLADGLRAWLIGARRPLVPHAHVPDPAGGRVTEDKLVIVLRAVRGEEPVPALVCGAVTARDIRPCPGTE
jgi:hypothetical protein